jgi:hypothetical protein
MSNPLLWLLFFVLLVLVASWWSRTLIGLVAGLVLIGVGGATALWGVPHLRDALVLRCLKASEYGQPQQPGLYAIAVRWGTGRRGQRGGTRLEAQARPVT